MPTTIDERRTGATSISRRNPSSRSITSEIALNIALKTSAMQRIPGKMNVLSSTPPVDAAASVCSPAPSTNRNSSGWTSIVAIRMRSVAKRIRSRRQTIRIARASERQERSGTRTATTSMTVTLIGGPPPARASSRG